MARKLTITLSDDVAALLEKKAKQRGVAPEEFVTDGVREMVAEPEADDPQKPFVVQARDMGLRPGLSLDNIEALLDEIEGPMRR